MEEKNQPETVRSVCSKNSVAMEEGNQPERNGKKKKINDAMIAFIKKQPESRMPRYITKLESYVELHRKRLRANNARRRVDAAKEDNKKEATDIEKTENDKTFPQSTVNSADDESRLERTTDYLATAVENRTGWFAGSSGGAASKQVEKKSRAPRSHSKSMTDEDEPSMGVCECDARNSSPQLVFNDSETDDSEGDEPRISMSFWTKLKKMLKCRRRRRRRRSCGRKRRRRRSCGRKRRRRRRRSCGRKRRRRRSCGRKRRRRRRRRC